MPGLLAQMDSDIGGKEELDWGVVSVMTCLYNCTRMGPWSKEYVFRQEISTEGLKSEPDMK
jgi:hypothetical protein